MLVFPTQAFLFAMISRHECAFITSRAQKTPGTRC